MTTKTEQEASGHQNKRSRHDVPSWKWKGACGMSFCEPGESRVSSMGGDMVKPLIFSEFQCQPR